MFAKTLLPVLLGAVGTYGLQYNVTIGAGGQLAFNPEYIRAAVGDTVRFTFNPKNHTITQSSFDTPCLRLEGGLDSGFVPVAAETLDESKPTWFASVNVDTPLWFYCRQGNHCSQGMVFAINPPDESSERSFAAFKQLALAQAAPSDTATATTPPTTTTDTWTTPPAQPWQTATATITQGSSVWTTTYTSYEGASVPSPGPSSVDHKITVGANGQLLYGPSNISAVVGDTVTFEFYPKNHTVTQSSFSNPCQPAVNGFRSGFQPVSAETTTLPTFQIRINDTAPIWGYCGQGNHCNSGMVFAINAVESGPNNFANFLELARRSGGSASSGTGSGTGTGGSQTNGTSGTSGSPNGASSMTFGRSGGMTYGMIGLVTMMFALL